MTIWLASGNKHKQQELAAILAGSTVRLPAEAGITAFDPAETGSSFAENALIKARALHALLASKGNWPEAGSTGNASPVLADDSGLCIDALGGRPGIYSARYYGKGSWAADGSFLAKPGAGEKCTDMDRNILLLEELDGIAKSRRCRFVCAMVLLFSPDRFYLAQETLEGEIVPSAAEIRGQGGFGYDPIMYLPELGHTVAELLEEEKNRLSHRAKAGRAIAKLLAGD